MRSVWKQILKIGAPTTVAAPRGRPDAAEQCRRRRSIRRRRLSAQCGSSHHRCWRRRHGAVVAVRRLAASGLSVGFYCNRSSLTPKPPHAGIFKCCFYHIITIFFLVCRFFCCWDDSMDNTVLFISLIICMSEWFTILCYNMVFFEFNFDIRCKKTYTVDQS